MDTLRTLENEWSEFLYALAKVSPKDQAEYKAAVVSCNRAFARLRWFENHHPRPRPKATALAELIAELTTPAPVFRGLNRDARRKLARRKLGQWQTL